MFAAEFQPAQLDGRRRSPRAPVSLDAKIGGNGFDRALCKVIDLSIHGARIQTYSDLKPSTVIWLTLPQVGPVAARIVWCENFVAGCQFETPLAAEAFLALVGDAAPRAVG